MMKILKEKSRSYKNKNYYKYKINVPLEAIEKTKLKEGDELEIIELGHQTITLKKKRD